MSAHACHAAGCTTPVPPRSLMCARHWRMVPLPLKKAILRTYRPGQERLNPRPSADYIRAHKRAVNAVADAEDRPPPYPVDPADAYVDYSAPRTVTDDGRAFDRRCER